MIIEEFEEFDNETPPDPIITEASELAYEENMDMVVGKDESGKWVIRCWEDPEETNLRFRVVVNSEGIKE